MDKNRLGVVSYHELFEMVYNVEAAAQVRVTTANPSLRRVPFCDINEVVLAVLLIFFCYFVDLM